MYLSLFTAAVSTIAVTLLWVHFSNQQGVKRTVLHSARIALSLLILNAAVFFLMCRVFSFTDYFYLATIAIAFLIAAPLSAKMDPPSDEFVHVAAILIVAVPLYTLKQIVLGFPDREHVILSPPSTPPVETPTPTPKTKSGTTPTALRPMGTVDFSGEHFNATSATGRMISAGQTVHWTGHRGSVLLVDELP